MATGSGPGQPEATAVLGAGYELAPRTASPLVRLGRLARKKPLGAISAVIIVVMLFAGIFAEVVAPFDPLEPHGKRRLGDQGCRARPFQPDRLWQSRFLDHSGQQNANTIHPRF